MTVASQPNLPCINKRMDMVKTSAPCRLTTNPYANGLFSALKILSSTLIKLFSIATSTAQNMIWTSTPIIFCMVDENISVTMKVIIEEEIISRKPLNTYTGKSISDLLKNRRCMTLCMFNPAKCPKIILNVIKTE